MKITSCSTLFLVGLLGWGTMEFSHGQISKEDPSLEKKSVVFYAMGDVPYTMEQEQTLRDQITALPSDGRFCIHVGDIKAGATPCDEQIYVNVASILQRSQVPLFILPGDNEWNDCIDPEPSWQFWQRHFMRFDDRWHHQLKVFRQVEREENFSLVADDVLFLGVNIVGGKVHDESEWKERHQQNLDWVRLHLKRFGDAVSSMVLFGHATPTPKHVDFFGPLSVEAEKFAKPILYLHGDGHRWIQDRPFDAQNILRIQVDQGGLAPPLRVEVTGRKENPFVFDRRQ